MTRGKLATLLGTCRQLEAWLMIDPNFQEWPAAQSYLKQLQNDLEPFLCPTCKDIMPLSGPCPCSDFGERQEASEVVQMEYYSEGEL